MLRWTVIFLIVAIIAAIFGFGGIAAGAAGIAKFLILPVYCPLYTVTYFRKERNRYGRYLNKVIRYLITGVSISTAYAFLLS
jgi:uncharacterized membrane protein YtjA (UPF0391 family)